MQAHRRQDLSRKDDMESWFYMWVFLKQFISNQFCLFSGLSKWPKVHFHGPHYVVSFIFWIFFFLINFIPNFRSGRDIPAEAGGPKWCAELLDWMPERIRGFAAINWWPPICWRTQLCGNDQNIRKGGWFFGGKGPIFISFLFQILDERQIERNGQMDWENDEEKNSGQNDGFTNSIQTPTTQQNKWVWTNIMQQLMWFSSLPLPISPLHIVLFVFSHCTIIFFPSQLLLFFALFFFSLNKMFFDELVHFYFHKFDNFNWIYWTDLKI